MNRHILLRPTVQRQGQQRRIVSVKSPTVVRIKAPPPTPVSVADRLRDFVKPTIVIRSQPVVKERPSNNNGVSIESRPRSLEPIRRPPNKRGPTITRITGDVSAQDVAAAQKIKGAGKGRILVILGNGPSLAEIDTSKLVGLDFVDTMMVNKPDERCWPTTYWTFFDPSQLHRNKHKWDTYSGISFNSAAIKGDRPGTIRFKNINNGGFQRNLAKGINIGRSSVYASIQIGMWLGYDRIYIIGCDMTDVNGKLHYYGNNPDVTAEERKRRFENESKCYTDAASVLTESERANIIFCSSYLKYQFVNRFQRIDHKYAIEFIYGDSLKLKAIHEANQLIGK